MSRSRIAAFLLRPRWVPRGVRRNRRGEVVHPQVSPPVRVLSGCLSLFMVWSARIVHYGGDDLGLVVLAGTFAAISGGIAVFGWNEAVIEPEASERFRELADPSRPLPPPDPPPAP